MKNVPDVVTFITEHKAGDGTTIRLLNIRYREDVKILPVDRLRAAQESLRIPVLFYCLGGLCELYSKGRLLKQFDRFEPVYIERDGNGIKAVELLRQAPFVTRKDLVQGAPVLERYFG